MTAAQREYLAAARIDPWQIEWRDAPGFGLSEYGATETALLPTGEVLLANGTVASYREADQ